MKLNELKAKKSGLPAGFSGERAKWNDIKEDFQILKAAMLQRPAVSEDGEILTYSDGPKKGEPIPDRQLVLMIRTRSGSEYCVRTNSRKITSLYVSDVEEREPDTQNQFGDDIFNVEAPEGWMHFVASQYTYKDGRKGDIADLEEAEED